MSTSAYSLLSIATLLEGRNNASDSKHVSPVLLRSVSSTLEATRRDKYVHGLHVTSLPPQSSVCLHAGEPFFVSLVPQLSVPSSALPVTPDRCRYAVDYFLILSGTMPPPQRREPFRAGYYSERVGSARVRCKEEVQMCYGMDPCTLRPGVDTTMDVNVFPEVTHGDIVNYLVYSSSFVEMKAFKSMEALKYFTSRRVRSLSAKVLLLGEVRTIESLLPFVKAANFVALANHYLPAIFEYSMSSEVASATPSLVHELGVFLHEEAPTGRALNLVRYLLFERLLPLSTSRLEETLDVNALDALNLRIRACRDAVRRVEPRVWQFLTLQEVLTRRRLSQSARIVSAVLNATLAEYAQWQDSVTLERTRARLQMLRAEASSTPLLSAADANRRYDYVLPVSYDTVFLRWFLTSLSSGVAHANASRVDALQDTDDLRQLDALRDSKVHIDPLDAVVRVSPGFLFAPFMVDDDVPPDGVNAGALGAAVGSLVAAFLDPMHGPLDGVSRSRVKYEPATASRYRKMLDCLRSRRSRQGPVIADDAEASQVLVKQLGVRIAYGAFEKMRNDSKAKSGNSTLMAELSELLGSAQRAFFAAHCFQFCQHEVPRNVAHATSGSFRCNAVLRDVEAFRKAFKCPAGSVMRPAHLCAI
ncbi:uncharacterized protein [Dermacentor albipictus]|uniref:uncharacterized protein isoform X5 n=1 Tax=Dermacentor albipictus TaxID=60249 RepID=UPI0038FD2FBA